MKQVSDDLRTVRTTGQFAAMYDTLAGGGTYWYGNDEVKYNSATVGFYKSKYAKTHKLRTRTYAEDGKPGHIYWLEAR